MTCVLLTKVRMPIMPLSNETPVLSHILMKITAAKIAAAVSVMSQAVDARGSDRAVDYHIKSVKNQTMAACI